MFVDQQAHELGDRNRRVRVVQLNRPLLVKSGQGTTQFQVNPQHVLKGAADEKILLLESKHLPLHHIVIRIEHLGEVLRFHLGLDRAVVVPVVERPKVKGLHSLGPPKAHRIAGTDPVSQHRRVVGDPFDHRLRDPPNLIAPLFVRARLGTPPQSNPVDDFRTDNLPRISEVKPLVRHFHLPSIANDLVEDAELITDAVPDGRHLQRSHGIQIAGGESAKPAVAQARFLLPREDLIEIQTKLRHRRTRGALETQVQQVIAQMRSRKKLGRKVRHRAGIAPSIVLHR